MIIIILTLFFSSVYSKSLPPDINRCSRSAPNFNDCMAVKITEGIRKFGGGNKELGLARLEPFFIKNLSFGGNETDSRVNIHQVYENLNVHNVTAGVIYHHDMKISGDNWYWKFKTMNPHVKMEGDYKMTGQLLVFPINGHGKFSIDLYDIKNSYEIKLEEFTKNGKKHLRITDFVFKSIPKRGVLKFDNVIDGNEDLSREVIKTANENFDVIYQDVGKYFDEAFSLIWKEMINRLFSRVSEDELFLP